MLSLWRYMQVFFIMRVMRERISNVMLHNFRILWQANQGGGSGSNNSADSNAQQESNENQQHEQPKDFAAWLDAQPDEIKTIAQPLFENHVKDLQSAVKATRRERDDFAKQLRDATRGMEDNSKLKSDFEKLASNLEESNRRADFFEEAPAQECRNPKAAYAIAVTNDLFNKHGAPDWKEIKTLAPELFGAKNVVKKRTAGSGSENGQTSGSMSDWIRRAANKTTVDL